MNFKDLIEINNLTNPNKILFPFEFIRKSQLDFINTYYECLNNDKNLLVSAPTGIGKTVAALAPAITYALENDKVIFFLTSRSTQHKIVLETIEKIQEKYNKKIPTVDLIGKKWMCNQPSAVVMNPNEFSNFCKSHIENKSCNFYTNLKENSTYSKNTLDTIKHIKENGPLDVDQTINICSLNEVCTYEITTILAKEAKVIIGDYFHLFNHSIRSNILSKMKININDIIVIVDEGHNLSSRIKDLATISLNEILLSRIEKIMDEKLLTEESAIIKRIKIAFHDFYTCNLIERDIVEFEIKKDLIKKIIENIIKYNSLIDLLIEAEEKIEDPKKKAPLQQLIAFLVDWDLDNDNSYVRVFSTIKIPGGKKTYKISLNCLDPAPITKQLINAVHSTVLMSATLEPTKMYKEIIGFEDNNSITREYDSVFSKLNRLNLIVPETTSRYAFRNEENYKKIGDHIKKIVSLIPGNIAIFFPSYDFRDKVAKYFTFDINQTVLFEDPSMSKYDRKELIEKFISYKEIGSVLLGVVSGSFAEGIDLPGDQLKAVIIVGLPLSTPDLITKKTITYYDNKYRQGWNYAYIYPAMAKTIQSAGRCIRSETDRGAIIFLEERYINSNYYNCFPKSWDIQINRDYEQLLLDFFKK